MTNSEKLKRIAEIIESVDQRCMAADGPVTRTLEEMTQAEMSEIYSLASNKDNQPDAEYGDDWDSGWDDPTFYQR